MLFRSGDNFTLQFSPEDSLVNGTATCNKFFGRYTLSGNNKISIDIIGATMAACPEIEYEHPFFNMLNTADSYQLRGERLILFKENNQVASFETYMIGTVHHITDKSLKYLGEYVGVLPAADCPGIETKLSINNDSSYVLDMNYIDRNTSFQENGTYSIEGNIIKLIDEKGRVSYYKIDNDSLIMLDEDKKPIAEGTEMASHFVLKKVIDNK